MFLPTTTVDLHRDADPADADVFGDPTETGTTPLAEDVPASVVMSSFSRSTLADLSEDRVITWTVRLARRWGVRSGDRVYDRQTGAWYLVGEVSTPPSLAGAPSSRLVCTQVGTPTP